MRAAISLLQLRSLSGNASIHYWRPLSKISSCDYDREKPGHCASLRFLPLPHPRARARLRDPALHSIRIAKEIRFPPQSVPRESHY